MLDHERGARVAGKVLFMADQEVPIQRGHGAGVRAGAHFGLVTAAFAIVAHAVDVLAAGHIRFAGEATAVGVQGHAQGVGRFHPFHGVHVHGAVPGADLLR